VPSKIVQQLGYKPADTALLSHTDYVSSHNVLTRLCTAPVSPYIFLAACQGTAHPVVPVHTPAEFNLFTKMLETAKYFMATKKQPIAAHSSKNVDFKTFARDWTDQVHLAAGEDKSKDQRKYYKLPEQLEQHYQVWAASRARAATMTNTVQMRWPFTTIISDPSRQARVLPAIPLPNPSNMSGSLSHSQKGKARAIEASQDNETLSMHSNFNHMLASRNLDLPEMQQIMPPHIPDHPSYASVPSTSAALYPPPPVLYTIGHGPPVAAAGSSIPQFPNTYKPKEHGPKKHGPKKCAACKKYGCQRVNDCAGSGGRLLCHCANHPRLQPHH
jgi:hypothetical protein